MRGCALCPRLCGARREAGEIGLCGGGALPKVARAALHMWEEPCLSGTRGSGTIFFSGCSLGCVYCQNAPISLRRFGREVTPRQLRGIMLRLIGQGAHNINLVTPTHEAEAILEALEGEPLSVPVVWNSGGYERPETIERLAGRVDVFLPDWKYALAEPALLYSSVPDYPEVAEAAIGAMIDIAGPPAFDADGLLRSGVLARHLVLPGHPDNTRAVIDKFARKFKGRALFSLMGQYVPFADPAKHPRIARKLSRGEYRRMREYLLNAGVEDGYFQEAGADDTAYIPDFDLTGVEE